MKVHWTNAAEGHLDAIFRHIAQNSPEYAKRMVDRITRRSQQIAEYPLSGRRVTEYDFNQIREGHGRCFDVRIARLAAGQFMDRKSDPVTSALTEDAIAYIHFL